MKSLEGAKGPEGRYSTANSSVPPSLGLYSGRGLLPAANASAEHSLFAGSSVWGSVASGGRNMSTKDLNTEQDGLAASQALPRGRTEEAWLILVGVERGHLP